MALTYALVLSATSILSFRNFGMSAFDVGIHVQAVWKLAFGRGLFNTVRGLPIWGDHCWLITAFYAPIYRALPRVETLLILQSVALAAGALPLAAIAYRRTRSRSAALAFAAAWLLSPALQNMNLENFHPEVIAAPLLLWAIERALAERWTGYYVATTLALLCKEDVALTVFVLGLWILRRNRAAGIATMVGSAIWFGLCLKVILPYFNDRGFFRLEGGYWFSQFWQNKFDPGYYWNTVFTTGVSTYGWQLSSPLLFLFVLSPLLAAAAIPGFLVNALSGNEYLASIYFHYNFQTLPVLFAAAVLGFDRLRRRLLGRRAVHWLVLAGVVVASVWANDRWSHLPARGAVQRITSQYAFFKESGTDSRFRRIAAGLPSDPDVPISVSHNLLPHLANRSEVYMFPNPFRAVYWGIAGEGLPDEKRIEALLLDTNSADPAISRRLLATGEFVLEQEAGPLVLAKRVRSIDRQPIPVLRSLRGTRESIRLLAFVSEDPVESLTPLEGRVPDFEISTRQLHIPLTVGRLESAEGLDLGAADNLRLVFAGSWEAQGAEEVVFRIQADDGCRLWIDGEVVVDYDGVHPFSHQVASEPMRLTAGAHSIVVDYFEWGGEAGLSIEWAPPGGRFERLQAGQRLP